MNVKRIAFVLAISFLSHNAHGSTWAKIDPNSVRGHADQTINHIFEPYKHTEAMQIEIKFFKSECLPRVVNQVMQYTFKTEHEAKQYADKLIRHETTTFYLKLLVARTNQYMQAINENGPGRLANGFRFTNHLKNLETMFDITFAK